MPNGGIGSDWGADKRNNTPDNVRANDRELKDHGGNWDGGNSHSSSPDTGGHPAGGSDWAADRRFAADKAGIDAREKDLKEGMDLAHELRGGHDPASSGVSGGVGSDWAADKRFATDKTGIDAREKDLRDGLDSARNIRGGDRASTPSTSDKPGGIGSDWATDQRWKGQPDEALRKANDLGNGIRMASDPDSLAPDSAIGGTGSYEINVGPYTTVKVEIHLAAQTPASPVTPNEKVKVSDAGVEMKYESPVGPGASLSLNTDGTRTVKGFVGLGKKVDTGVGLQVGARIEVGAKTTIDQKGHLGEGEAFGSISGSLKVGSFGPDVKVTVTDRTQERLQDAVREGAEKAVRDAEQQGKAGAAMHGMPGLGFQNPVVLDLDRDGKIALIAATGSAVCFDWDGDGLREKTGWVGPKDGLLFYDKAGDGMLSGTGQIAFTSYVEGARTDLDGLRFFDTDKDGRLDAGDGEFGKFKVWQDKNQDGRVDPGELVSLKDAGIASIGLDAKASQDILAGNPVHGYGSATLADGKTMLAGDVALASSFRGFEDAQVAAGRLTAVTEDNGLLIRTSDLVKAGGSITAVGAVTHGTAVLHGNGVIEFVPDADFNGRATIAYAGKDAAGKTTSGTLQVEVVAANDAPYVAGIDWTDGPAHNAGKIRLADVDDASTKLTIRLADGGGPLHGTIDLK